jgi:hypothetical protein
MGTEWCFITGGGSDQQVKVTLSLSVPPICLHGLQEGQQYSYPIPKSFLEKLSRQILPFTYSFTHSMEQSPS